MPAAGKSPYKNTQPLLEAWARNPDFPPLTISTYEKETITLVKQFMEDRRGLGYRPLNIRLVDTHMTVDALNSLLLSIGNHVCPSQKEGFGHYINQARAASALLITTGEGLQAPPQQDGGPVRLHSHPHFFDVCHSPEPWQPVAV